MNFHHIEKLSKTIQNEKLVQKLAANIDSVNEEFTSNIIEASEKEITPEEEDGKKLVNFGNVFRQFGYKLLNLLKVELTISFASITLLHFVLPNVENGSFVEKKSSREYKKL